jgi:predicted nucleic acid-binding protein
LILDTNALSLFLEFGIAQSRPRAHYERSMRRMFERSTVLGIDTDTAHHYAEIRLDLKKFGRPVPPNDAWIAALARQHGFPVTSRDRHFDSIPGVRRRSW